jgi:TnpA family transposase
VVIYWHVEKKATCVYSQLKQCSSSEVAAAITGVMRHCTEMQIKQHYVDSHGQSEVAFGMCHLLGYELCPRLKPIHSQKLYLPDSAEASRYPRLKPVLTRSIDWARIRQEYDELVKYATAIGSGTAEVEAILRRFTRHSTHPTYKAFIELGRVMKTIFLCQYLHKEELRREIQEGLNVVENWNSANSFVFYGRHGELATNRRDNQEVAMLALHLVQNCLVYINTVMIQETLAEPAWMKRMTERDLRALTPLIYHRVNPYGIFALDLKKRLPFKELQAA